MNILSPLSIISSVTETVAKNSGDALSVLTGHNTSYADLASQLRITPTLIMDRKLTEYPHTSPIVKGMISLFSAYYCQGFSALTAKEVTGVKVMETFDNLNPSKKINWDVSRKGEFTLESAYGQHGVVGQTLNERAYQFGLPNITTAAVIKTEPSLNVEAEDADKRSMSKIETAVISQDSSLGVGKLVDVTLKTEKGTITFPLTFRPNIGVVDSSVFKSFAALGGKNLSFTERFFEYRAGVITGQELLFLTDVTAERRKVMMGDKSGYFKNLLSNRENTALKTLVVGGKSYGNATAMMVVDRNTVRGMEEAMHGSFTDYNVRKRFFEKTLMLFLVVVDTEIDVLTIYYRDIAQASEVNVTDFANIGGKSSSQDLTKTLQALMAGRAPVF